MSDETHSGTDPLTQLRDITATGPDGAVLERLQAAGLVDLGDDLPVRDVLYEAERDGTSLVATFGEEEGEAAALDATPIGRLTPRQSRRSLPDGRVLGMYVQDCLISTEAEPPYHRLPSFASHFPYHIVYLLKFPPNQTHTVDVTLQVFSAGTVRITGLNSPAALTVGQSSIPLKVPVGVRTTNQGFASILIQRNGEVGFDWFSAAVF
ncbi:hypothetical protein [Promicromonospora kroppenstedtii]|uniref:hypothetical protein n=1 Tax=Promicromonospora kroppenstedtii TaxID=440482 RepID=UPI0004B58354|nr:hypothetical protein [Promicromonospora kroppenstedtii]